MNYRHAYHAGNAADVMKHVVLTLILERLNAKPAPYCVLDTHAGIGRYDLEGTEARKTGEADAGIRRLLSATNLPADLDVYLEAVRRCPDNTPGEPLRWYPGSPRLARSMMRADDRLILAELHAEDVRTLKAEFRDDPQAQVHHMDGWLALKAHLPPKQKRGLVLVDPPFEATDEYERLVQGLRLAHGRWSTGIYALWYPIKDRAAVWNLHQALENSGLPRILAAEYSWADEDRVERMVGCGMIVVNPPWQLDDRLRTVLPALQSAMSTGKGGWRVEWIAPE